MPLIHGTSKMSHPPQARKRHATVIHTRAEFPLAAARYAFSAASTRSGVNGM